MSRTARLLLLIVVLALALRIALGLAFVRFPGIADPNHYYNMGIRLSQGQGFTIDYIWQYSSPPDAVTQPEEHWMPLAAVMAAAPMTVFGQSTAASLVLFVVVGSLLPLLSFAGAKQLGASDNTALYSALAAACLPELVLNSLRTDTTVPTALFVCGFILLLVDGMRRGGWWRWALAGACGGLAWLTRNDGLLLLPMLLVVLVADAWTRRAAGEPGRASWRGPLVLLGAMLLVMSPWLARNYLTFGAFGSAETRSMFFFTDNLDHYAFARTFTLETLLAAQTPGEIIGKRAFELAAGLKQILTGLGDFLMVAFAAGVVLVAGAVRRDRRTFMAALPVVVLLAGGVIAYAVFIPYKAQAGSLKKAFLMTTPLLIPIAALALERLIASRRWRALVMGISALLLAFSAFDLVRLDAAAANSYLASIRAMAAVADTLPDVTGDGEITLMTQDPYIVSYAGFPALMYPFEERALVHEIALRYGVDYLLFPAARPSLDGLPDESPPDPRFTLAAEVPSTAYQFYRVEDAP